MSTEYPHRVPLHPGNFVSADFDVLLQSVSYQSLIASKQINSSVSAIVSPSRAYVLMSNASLDMYVSSILGCPAQHMQPRKGTFGSSDH